MYLFYTILTRGKIFNFYDFLPYLVDFVIFWPISMELNFIFYNFLSFFVILSLDNIQNSILCKYIYFVFLSITFTVIFLNYTICNICILIFILIGCIPLGLTFFTNPLPHSYVRLVEFKGSCNFSFIYIGFSCQSLVTAFCFIME